MRLAADATRRRQDALLCAVRTFRAGRCVTDFDPHSPRAGVLAAHPDAMRWARDCKWVPATGYCPTGACSPECLFRVQREQEAQRIVQSRQRRRSQLPAPRRAAPMRGKPRPTG
jgi:hypothetical protein